MNLLFSIVIPLIKYSIGVRCGISSVCHISIIYWSDIEIINV